MPILAAPLDFAKLEARNLRAHQLAAAPGSPVTGQLYYDTGSNTLFYYNGSTWVAAGAGAGPSDATTSTKGIVQLAGDLAGTAASPQIAALAITDAEVATANKDGVAGTASLRTLGSGATQAAAGNDSRFTDARTPTGTAGGDLSGTYPNPQILTGSIIDTDVNATYKDGAVGTFSLRTLGAGAAQAMPGNRTLDAISAPTASLNLNNQRIISLTDPTGAQDAATKAYVDAVAVGLDVKGSVKAATTANITLSATQTVDGIALVANDRCLVKNQTTQSANGIYSVQAGAWTRVTDMDVWGEVPGAFCFVEQGTTQADTGWVCTADAGGTLNTTNITFAQFSGAGAYTAGNGLTQTGTTFDAVGTANRITVAADSIDISTAYVGQGTITTLGTITTGVWNGTAVPVANGGTGATNSVTARINLGFASYYNNAATHGAGTTITIAASTHLCRASRGLIVQVQDNATGTVQLADVAVASNGDVTVTFGASQTANTILVTIIG